MRRFGICLLLVVGLTACSSGSKSTTFHSYPALAKCVGNKVVLDISNAPNVLPVVEIIVYGPAGVSQELWRVHNTTEHQPSEVTIGSEPLGFETLKPLTGSLDRASVEVKAARGTDEYAGSILQPVPECKNKK